MSAVTSHTVTHAISPDMRSHAARLYEKFSKRGRDLVTFRRMRLKMHHAMSRAGRAGKLPTHGGCVLSRVARGGGWSVTLPDWCIDQRVQLVSPANDEARAVKLINAQTQGVVLDLEDSMINDPARIRMGLSVSIKALEGLGTHAMGEHTTMKSMSPVIFVRPRGIQLSETVTIDGTEHRVPAALHDVIELLLGVDHTKLKRPPCVYIPKMESSDEALWWRDLFRDVSDVIGQPSSYIKCMALVESHPIAHEMDELIYHLRDHILGLAFGSWDYIASLMHWTLEDPAWLLPDRDTIPRDAPFLHDVERLMIDTCHKRGILAIGSMETLFPDRSDPVRDAEVTANLSSVKRIEASMGYDGSPAGHPDQVATILARFPSANQLGVMQQLPIVTPNLRVVPDRSLGPLTLQGTREAVRSSIAYRYGVLMGRGVSLLGGRMEGLATDRVNRLLIAQRMRHWATPKAPAGLGDHSVSAIMDMFESESNALIASMHVWNDTESVFLIKKAALETVESIVQGRFDPE